MTKRRKEQDEEEDDDQEFNVETVLEWKLAQTGRKWSPWQVEYLVKWQGYDHSHDIWIPRANFEGSNPRITQQMINAARLRVPGILLPAELEHDATEKNKEVARLLRRKLSNPFVVESGVGGLSPSPKKESKEERDVEKKVQLGLRPTAKRVRNEKEEPEEATRPKTRSRNSTAITNNPEPTHSSPNSTTKSHSLFEEKFGIKSYGNALSGFSIKKHHPSDAAHEPSQDLKLNSINAAEITRGKLSPTHSNKPTSSSRRRPPSGASNKKQKEDDPKKKRSVTSSVTPPPTIHLRAEIGPSPIHSQDRAKISFSLSNSSSTAPPTNIPSLLDNSMASRSVSAPSPAPSTLPEGIRSTSFGGKWNAPLGAGYSSSAAISPILTHPQKIYNHLADSPSSSVPTSTLTASTTTSPFVTHNVARIESNLRSLERRSSFLASSSSFISSTGALLPKVRQLFRVDEAFDEKVSRTTCFIWAPRKDERLGARQSGNDSSPFLKRRSIVTGMGMGMVGSAAGGMAKGPPEFLKADVESHVLGLQLVLQGLEANELVELKLEGQEGAPVEGLGNVFIHASEADSLCDGARQSENERAVLEVLNKIRRRSELGVRCWIFGGKNTMMKEIWTQPPSFTVSPAAFQRSHEEVSKFFKQLREFDRGKACLLWVPSPFVAEGGVWHRKKVEAELDELDYGGSAHTAAMMSLLAEKTIVALATLQAQSYTPPCLCSTCPCKKLETSKTTFKTVQTENLHFKSDLSGLIERSKVLRSLYPLVRRWIVIVTTEEKVKVGPCVEGIELMNIDDVKRQFTR
ncbi:hypothetical protein T439DRAFT_375859 [Meredithblackwellia eburnea MCA 4105]